jgi:hypothetical protein
MIVIYAVFYKILRINLKGTEKKFSLQAGAELGLFVRDGQK